MKKCIVVGAGILGASTAYRLARLGADVLIVDRHDAGQATQAAAGIICPWLSQRRNRDWYRLATAGARYYPELIAELELEGETQTGYARVGALSIHADGQKLVAQEERARQRREDAPEIGELVRLDEMQTRERFPLLSAGYEALAVSGAARVDGRALRDALLRAAARHGARQLTGDAVLLREADGLGQRTDRGAKQRDGARLHADAEAQQCEGGQSVTAGRVAGVRIGDDIYEADEVIVCAGAWAASLLEPLGLHFAVSYQKAQIVHLQLTQQMATGDWPVVIPPSTQYVLAFEEGRIVIGATHEDDIDGYDTRITAGGVHEVLSRGIEVADGLREAELLEVRVGFRPHTPGYLPVLGRVPGWDGLLAANGLGSSGLTVGPWLGGQLARLALDLEPEQPLEAYGLGSAIGTLDA